MDMWLYFCLRVMDDRLDDDENHSFLQQEGRMSLKQKFCREWIAKNYNRCNCCSK